MDFFVKNTKTQIRGTTSGFVNTNSREFENLYILLGFINKEREISIFGLLLSFVRTRERKTECASRIHKKVHHAITSFSVLFQFVFYFFQFTLCNEFEQQTLGDIQESSRVTKSKYNRSKLFIKKPNS